MKHPHLETLARRMREHHRHHPWPLSPGGLYIPHAYDHVEPNPLSRWDDVGFILNGRRVMVWWVHPRQIVHDAIDALAWRQHEAELGPGPDPDWLTDGASTSYKRVGKSGKRKKPIGFQSRSPSEAQQRYYALLSERKKRLKAAGIAMDVHPSWTLKRYPWCMGIDLVAPMEVRNEQDLAQVAQLARDLMLRKTTLAERFPNARYGQADWLREQNGMRT